MTILFPSLAQVAAESPDSRRIVNGHARAAAAQRLGIAVTVAEVTDVGAVDAGSCDPFIAARFERVS